MPPQVTETANHLAGKDDRYLMIYAVVILIMGGGLIIYKLSKFLEKIFEKQSSQTEQLIATVEKCNGVIQRTGDQIDDNTRLLERLNIRFPNIPLLFLPIVLIFSGCAYRDYQAPDGTRLRSAVLLWKSKVEHVQVSTNGLKIIGAANAVDANAVESLSKGTAKGLTGQ